MPSKEQIIRPVGNMDKDSDVRYVGKGNNGGDTTDNRNTQIAGDSGSSKGDVTPTLGNEFAFSLGEVSAQNKKYRVTLDGDALKSHSLLFTSTKRDINIVTGSGPNGEVEFNGTASSLQSQFNNAISGQGVAWNVSVSGNVVEFELLSYPYYQWYLEDSGEDSLSVECIQEAIPTDLAGPLKDIGNYDLLGDLFIFSTSQDELPQTISANVIGVGPLTGTPPNIIGGPLTSITFDSDHGLQEGQWISINSSNAAWLNGTFVVHNIVSSTQIQIVTDTAWGANHPTFTVGEEVVTVNPNGIGEIGVAQKNDNTGNWTYTRLLRSVELNFVSRKAIRTDARVKGNFKIIYYTDKYNIPRFFKYTGEYSEDGALFFNNALNTYSYGLIDNQSNLLSVSSSSYTEMNYLGQSDTGGVLTSGNKYYIYRFSDSQDSKSNWSNPTRAIPIYPRSFTADAPYTIKGGRPEQITSKSVNLRVSGIPQGLFDSIDIAVIESEPSGAISGTIFNNVDIGESQQDILITHTGEEEESLPLDVGELSVSITSFQSIATAGDLTIIDKRLIMGNITYAQIQDIGEWTKTFTHKLEYKEIPGLRNITDERNGGYLDPNNVYLYPSLTLYETYRVAADVEFIDGTTSPSFWIDDIRVDTNSSNQANISDNRRVTNGGLPNYALNNPFTSNKNILVPHLKFLNIDMDFLISGTPIKNLIRSITFRFAKIEKEVLASGVLIMGVSGKMIENSVQVDSGRVVGTEYGPESNQHCQYLNWNSKFRTASPTGNISDEIADLDSTRNPYPDGFTEERKTAFFYSPEITQGELDDFELTSADKINVYYPMDRSYYDKTTKWNGAYVNTALGNLFEFGPSASDTFEMLPSDAGELIASPAGGTQADLDQSNGTLQYDIDGVSIMEAGTTDTISGVDVSTFHEEKSNGFGNNVYLIDDYDIAHSKCMAIRTSQDVVPFNSSYWSSNNKDYGVYYAQLYRERPNKYGEKETTQYQIYGQRYNVDEVENIETELAVYGGDAFTVKTLTRNRFPKTDFPFNPIISPQTSLEIIDNVGRKFGMTYMAQSYINMELVYDNTDEGFTSYPESYTGNSFTQFRDWIAQVGGEYIQFYNPAYSYGIGSISKEAYSESIQRQLDNVPTRIVYSSRDIYSSISDAMRVFLPANIFDLDGTFGRVESVHNVLGDLFVLQPRKYTALPFNARGKLALDTNAIDVLLKSGEPLSNDGKTLSTYGTSHKWSCIKGLNDNGKDTLYWFNQENGIVMRFGEDGTRVISERGMSSYFANYTKWTKEKYEHAYKEGIRGVWDDRRKEAIWTFTAWRDVDQNWSSGELIEEGEVYVAPNATPDSYELFPMFFRCKQVHSSNSTNEPNTGQDWEEYWEQIPYTDQNYYSIFTVCFNELTNGFRCFYGHLPKTYLKWQNTFLSSHPVNRNLIFEHRKGEYCTWYGVDTFLTGTILPKIEDAHFESVVNEVPEQSMRNLAISFLSEIKPDRVEYRTKKEYTYDDFNNPALYEERDDAFMSTIKNDATVNNDPEGDGSMLKGSYLRVKFIIFGGTYNLLHSIVVKFIDRVRRINR